MTRRMSWIAAISVLVGGCELVAAPSGSTLADPRAPRPPLAPTWQAPPTYPRFEDGEVGGESFGELGTPNQGTGHVAIRVRWPQRNILAIPLNTAKLTIAASAAQFNKSVDLAFGLPRAVFRNVPAGTLGLQATAFDAQAKILATTSAAVIVQSGGLVAVKLALGTQPGLSIRDLVPNFGGTGQQVEIKGNAFGDAGSEAAKVFVGGLLVAPNEVSRFSPNQIFFKVPNWATRSTVVVDVRGEKVTSSKDLFRLKALLLLPSSLTLKAASTGSVSVIGVDTTDETRSSTPVIWSAAAGSDHLTHDHTGADPHGILPLSVTPEGVITAKATGDFHVMARNGDLLATVSVKVIP